MGKRMIATYQNRQSIIVLRDDHRASRSRLFFAGKGMAFRMFFSPYHSSFPFPILKTRQQGSVNEWQWKKKFKLIFYLYNQLT